MGGCPMGGCPMGMGACLYPPPGGGPIDPGCDPPGGAIPFPFPFPFPFGPP